MMRLDPSPTLADQNGSWAPGGRGLKLVRPNRKAI